MWWLCLKLLIWCKNLNIFVSHSYSSVSICWDSRLSWSFFCIWVIIIAYWAKDGLLGENRTPALYSEVRCTAPPTMPHPTWATPHPDELRPTLNLALHTLTVLHSILTQCRHSVEQNCNAYSEHGQSKALLVLCHRREIQILCSNMIWCLHKMKSKISCCCIF
jgi:hypothetical protein